MIQGTGTRCRRALSARAGKTRRGNCAAIVGVLNTSLHRRILYSFCVASYKVLALSFIHTTVRASLAKAIFCGDVAKDRRGTGKLVVESTHIFLFYI